MPLSSVVGAQSIVKPGVCTSSTRPASPYVGQCIYETDTLLAKVWNGSTWADYPEGKLTATTAVTSNRNILINGSFNVWQRGTSFADSAFGLTVDRWEAGRGGFASGLTVSRQTGPTNFQYCARVQRASGNTSTQNIRFATTLETVNSLPLAGKTVTVSFYARAGANFSTSSSQIDVVLRSGTTTDAARIGAGDNFVTGAATPVSLTQPLTTSWQRFSVSGSVASTATQLALIVYASPTGTAGANDWYEITGVQVEAGAFATPFEFEDISETLTKCERYYHEQNTTYVYYNIFNSGNCATSFVKFPMTMRAAPTITVFDAVGNSGKITVTNAGGSTQNNITPPSSIDVNTDGWQYVAGGMGGTTGNNGMIHMSKYTASIEL